MEAVILAAHGTGASPTCLTRIGGRTLLQHQLDALRRAGAEAVHVVIGRGHREVRLAVTDVTFIHNEGHDETDSLYAFHLAAAATNSDDLVLLDGDTVFPDKVLTRLLAADGSSIAYDGASGEEDEQTKVHLRGGRLIRMGRELPTLVSDGESLGLIHLTAAAAHAAFEAAARLVASGRHGDGVGAAVSAITRQHPIAGVNTAGLPWLAIDSPAALAKAQTTTWPAIEELSVEEPALAPGYRVSRSSVGGWSTLSASA